MIRYQGVSNSYDGGKTWAVHDLSLDIEDGETMVLLGPSGCGKTTLLKMTNQLVPLASGSIQIEGDEISDMDPVQLRRRIGYVFQGVGLFPHMTIAENATIVPKLLGRGPNENQSLARELLALVDLDPDIYADRFPDELSGGQSQRVGVARALAADPHYLLMDEPFGALDAVTRKLLQDEMLRLKKQLGKTIVFVTHDIFEALSLGDRIAVLNQGRIEQVGTKEELVRQPASEYVEDLFKSPKAQLKEFQALLDGEKPL